MKSGLSGKKKLVRLPEGMEADIRAYCRDKSIESGSELIRQAVAKYIYGEYDDGTLKLSGLKDMQVKIGELRDMIDILFRYLRLAHINLLAYHPEIDSGFADAAFGSATGRHDKFFSVFQDSLKNDPPFFERLLHKYFSEGNDG